MPELIQRFPEGFLWGAATSAHQVEGDNRRNDWWRFEQTGAVAGGTSSCAASRHYERFDADFALAAGDGHGAHRLSIEWSRIEPERGAIDAAAVAHYHDVFASLRRHRLLPIVTLHHFTNPLWIADQGGWETPATLEAFVAFARFCGREFGGEVDWWCTINEPDVYAFRSYSEGVWPPRRRSDSAALRVIGNMLEAHGRAYAALHEEDRVDADGDGRAAVVGFAKHLTQLEAPRWSPLDRLRATIEDRVFNEALLRAPVTGSIALSVPGARAVRREVPELRGALDFLGINYYTRWRVHAIGVAHQARRGAAVTDLGWEIYPEGLAQAAERASRAAHDAGLARAARVPGAAPPAAASLTTSVPVLITEHGFADAQDAFRPRALVDSLLALGRAIDRGALVLGYLHWSLMDNFEWAEGFHGRFGLYGVDFDDPERPRRRRRSAEVYARIARANGIPRELVEEVQGA